MPKPVLTAAIAAAIVAVTTLAVSGTSDDGAVAAPPAAQPPAPAPSLTATAPRRLRVVPAPKPSPAVSRNARAVKVALRHLGTPYSYGGASPAGFDCSGLVHYAFSKVGVTLPHSSYALWDVGRRVERKDLRAGDLVYFNGLGHVGIYIGDGRYVHAPNSGEVVEVAPLSERDDYLGATRV
ncbi:MAG: C40 family peptidase [Thermoleophilia bacterium]